MRFKLGFGVTSVAMALLGTMSLMPAHAGHWSNSEHFEYTDVGGTFWKIVESGNPIPTLGENDIFNNWEEGYDGRQYGYYEFPVSTISALAQIGTITATLTWVHDNPLHPEYDPPPQYISVLEYSLAAWDSWCSDYNFSPTSLGPSSGHSHNGLGSPEISWLAPYGLPGTKAEGRRLTRKDASSGVVKLECNIDILAQTESSPNPLGATSETMIVYEASKDTREISVVPVGHEVTYHKQMKKDEYGNLIQIAPIPGHPEVTIQDYEPAANTVHDNTLPVDIGLPSLDDPHDPNPMVGLLSTNYQIDYRATVVGGRSTFNPLLPVDTYEWSSDLKGNSASGQVPDYLFNREGGYQPRDFTVNYTKPVLYPISCRLNNSGVPYIKYGDSQSLDDVTFKYTFASDNATAEYHVLTNLHQPDEHWQQYYQVLQTAADVAAVQYSDGWGNPSVSNNVVVTIPPSDTEMLFSTGYTLLGLTLAVASASETYGVAALFSSAGFIEGLYQPTQTTESFDNSLSEWEASCEIQIANPSQDIINPQGLATDTGINVRMANWGRCEFSLWKRVLNELHYYAGDHYEGLGYTGQVYKMIEKPYSWPHEFHFRQMTGATPDPNLQ